MSDHVTNGLVKIGHLFASWFGLHGINIIAILVGAWFIRRFGSEILNRILRQTIRNDLYPTEADRQKRIKTLDSLVGASTRVAVYIIATILIIGEINPQYTTALFASAGLLSVGVGIGAQSLIKDFFSGIFIILENQYRVGDSVTIGDTSGIVEAVTIRTTVLRDLNGHIHHVPNGTIDVTTNKSVGFGGINEDIKVAADTDLDRLAHIINHIGEEMASMPEFSNKITEPPVFARVVGFEDDGVVIKILGKTTHASRLKVKSELYKRLQKAFVANQIELVSSPALQNKPKKKH
jgi:moderate conductance mechanosensitive channel